MVDRSAAATMRPAALTKQTVPRICIEAELWQTEPLQAGFFGHGKEALHRKPGGYAGQGSIYNDHAPYRCTDRYRGRKTVRIIATNLQHLHVAPPLRYHACRGTIMHFLSCFRKLHRRKGPQEVEHPPRRDTNSDGTAPHPRFTETYAGVCATRASQHSKSLLTPAYALVEPAPKRAAMKSVDRAPAAKPNSEAELHTLRRSLSCVFQSDLKNRISQADGPDWRIETTYDFTLGRHIVALQRQVWGMAHPVEYELLRGESVHQVTRELDRMENAGWHITEIRAPLISALRQGYEIQLQRQRIDELPAPSKVDLTSNVAAGCDPSGSISEACTEKVEL